MAGLDDLIGSLEAGGSRAPGGAGGAGLEDVLGGILGGAGQGGGGLGDVLGGILGGGGSAGGGSLEDVLGGILGGGQGSRSSGGGAGLGGLVAVLAPVVVSLLKHGGLTKILSGAQASGLSSQADSWVGTGANEPVGAADVRQALGDDEVAQIAGQLGVDPDRAAEVLAGILPGLVDTVTPGGEVPSDDELDRFADAFAGLAPSS